MEANQTLTCINSCNKDGNQSGPGPGEFPYLGIIFALHSGNGRRYAEIPARPLPGGRMGFDRALNQIHRDTARELACWCWAVGRMAEGA